MKPATLFLSLAVVGLVTAGTISLSASGAFQAEPPPPTDEQVGERLCREAVEEIIDARRIPATVARVDFATVEPAAFDDLYGLSRDEMRSSWEAMSQGDDGFRASRQRQFDSREWIHHAYIVTFEAPFRSQVTLMDGVLCSVLSEAGLPLHAARSLQLTVRINGATALDHTIMRLPL